uniref:Uncharacterized protein n=1 Tax=Rhizophagus irregularis (strain DAOM 181602 / DAOM 197198 / MUCL 43194) TaxID=747089 RepID=U9SKP9_RHIID
MYENIPEASILEMFETEIESDESEEPAIFALDEEYLKKIVELYTEDTSETDSISTDDNDDLISELCSEDIIIEQKESKILTCCVIVNKIDGCIKRCENSKSFRTLWQLCGVWQIDGEKKESDEKEYEEIGQKMGQELWKSSKHLKKNKNNLQNPESLSSYIGAFPRPLITFFESMLMSILENKTAESNHHNTNNRIDPLWKLSHDLLEAFKMDNAIDHDLFKKNSPPQLNQEGLMKINQAYEDGLGRIKEIFRQEVIKTEAINTKGRRVLSVMKTKISDLSKNKKPRKNTVPTIPEGDNEGSSQLARVLQTIQFNEQDSQSVLKDKNINPKRKCIELPENQENVESQPPLKRQRVVTTEEEKEILKCLLQKKIMPSENEINEVLTKLPQSWNIQCIKRYWSNNRCKEN